MSFSAWATTPCRLARVTRSASRLPARWRPGAQTRPATHWARASWRWSPAAAMPETYFTVWTNVFDRGGLKAGETLLVHGGASGIGTTAIALAKAFGARVVATAGSDDKARRCEWLGADLGVNYRTEDFVQQTIAATDGRGAEVILDMVGGDYV